jgi:hypothetical protein
MTATAAKGHMPFPDHLTYDLAMVRGKDWCSPPAPTVARRSFVKCRPKNLHCIQIAERNASIIASYLAGDSMYALGKRWNIHAATVRYVLKAHGIGIRPARGLTR